MQHTRYPFIDLAVHDAIRERFAAGEALAVASPDLSVIHWANGAAADLFGHAAIYDLIEDGLEAQPALKRQIAAAVAGLARKGGQDFLMRVTRGFRRLVIGAHVQLITMPGGGAGVLISSDGVEPVRGTEARARQIISGFEGTDTHVAVLDEAGKTIAASPSFGEAALAADALMRMVRDVAEEPDRLVKRRVDGTGGPMPAAIGRLTDNPALHLLLAVEADEAASAITENRSHPAGREGGLDIARVREELRETGFAAASDADQGADRAAGKPTSGDDKAGLPLPFDEARHVTQGGIEHGRDSDTDDGLWAAVPSQLSSDMTDEERSAPDAATTQSAGDLPQASGAKRAVGDLSPSDDTAEADNAEDEEFVFDPAGRPVRFVWKMNRDGAFSEVSGEFAAAVGPHAADIVGRQFPDIARVFNLDPDHAISDLLTRRDTWSGKTVLWPVQGTDLVVPIDLAALPTYTRDRRFDGFRGFGIVRIAEARSDKEAIGLALTPGGWKGPLSRGTGTAGEEEVEAGPRETGPAATGQIDAERASTAGTNPASADGNTPSEAAEGDHDHVAAIPEMPFDASRLHRKLGASAETVAASLDKGNEGMREVASDKGAPSGVHKEAANDAAAPHDGRVAEEASSESRLPPTITPDDPFQGEAPALKVTPTARRRESDKVIDLEARRARSRETLTPLERAAFEEIGERLGTSLEAESSDAAIPPTSKEADDQPPASSTGDKRADTRTSHLDAEEHVAPAAGKASAAADDVIEPDETADAEESRDHSLAHAAAEGSDTPEARDPEGEAINGAPETETDAPSEVSTDTRAAVEPSRQKRQTKLSASVELPPRTAMPQGFTPDMIDMIPAALLVHSGDTLLHANADFFELTGYDSLEKLVDAGGLHSLLDQFPEPHDAGTEHSEEAISDPGGNAAAADSGPCAPAAREGASVLRRADGSTVPVRANLRSIKWQGGRALLFALTLPGGEIATDQESAVPAAAPPTPAEAHGEETADKDGQAAAASAAAESDEESSASETRDADAETEARLAAMTVEAGELRSILETATDGVVLIGEDNTIRSMNGAACALFGYDDAQTLDQPFAMLFAHESQRAVMDYLGGLAEHGVSSVLNDGREVIGREANGGMLPLFMTIGRLSQSRGYCAVLRDITQWKRSEEELRAAKRAAETASSHKSDFLARVSHEIRTPLNAIIGFSEMMVEERFGPIGSPRYLEYAHDIGSSGKHVLDIVNDLLDISKIEAGEIDLDFGSVSLNEQLAECVSMLQPMANSQRVIIRTSLSGSVPEVVADTRSIKQIALNLLSNAIRYTPAGGQIVVSTAYEANGSVVLRIRDTGIGMSRKELEQAMKPFGQVGPAPRQRGDGTGLGLPLTKAMVEANRARFDIVSAPKEGTLVTISFPSQRVLAE
ncbi:PAS domain-containing sensor histidine kinase [Pseudohoeflea coraliihabitans]|uniref:histidine kinase n=1 Tax=Pseudohoeflea coraliihabitans TaxID=2860393 RepID=A0ABS6WQJ9_9HYPH|nr:PAS domain-containing sensor histidine kinase [Pseudohoeflea sp. DP4N28-3]MBW3097320.1 PAS domain S-box protein [Pseudohoeflea sp. DP4N28-3]